VKFKACQKADIETRRIIGDTVHCIEQEEM
jgi:hypothetical protein